MTIGFSQSLKDGIIKEWLKGKNRDKIAYENAVSAGTVSNIIKEWRDQIGSLEADELREFSITLRKAGMTPLQCGSGFRVLNILHDLGFCEDDIEFFASDLYKYCKEVGLQPEKIGLHIKELIDLTEKIPLGQLSDYIQKNKNMLEESELELKNATAELKDTQAKLDNAFSKYNSSVSEIRCTYWLKSELKDRGLEFHSISDFVNTVEDLYTLGFDAKKIISKFSEIDNLETRKNTLENSISELHIQQDRQSKLLAMVKTNYLYTYPDNLCIRETQMYGIRTSGTNHFVKHYHRIS